MAIEKRTSPNDHLQQQAVTLLALWIVATANDLSTTGESRRQTQAWSHACKRAHKELKSHVIFECEPRERHIIIYSGTRPEMPNPYPVEELQRSMRITTNLTLVTDGPTTRKPRSFHGQLENATLQFDIPRDVTILRLWYQRISALEKSPFLGLSNLKILNLQQNKISYLSPGAFKGLSQLSELDMSYNMLQTLPDFVFGELRNLESLKIRHNELASIQDSTFCGLTSLSTLDVAHNLIKDISPRALRHFRSRYTVTMEFGNNLLTTPKKEWLIRAPNNKNDPLCRANLHRKHAPWESFGAKNEENKFFENPTGMEIVVKGTSDVAGLQHSSKITLPPVRMFRASHNPWSCTCDSHLCLIQFLRLYKSIMTSQFNGGKVVDVSEVFRDYNFNESSLPSKKHDLDSLPENITDPERYTKWYFTMPCEHNKSIDLGRLPTEQIEKIEQTCCRFLSSSETGKTILKRDKTLGRICAKDNDEYSGGLTESHVTIIGIVIVFSTPILLTLCPDCNRTITPSDTRGMTSAGKFGAVSINNSNNNTSSNFPTTTTTTKWQTDRKPFTNERFCLVVQTEKKPKSLYIEQVV